MKKKFLLLHNRFIRSRTGDHPPFDVGDETLFNIKEIQIEISGCDIKSRDGRWPISIERASDGTMKVTIANARIEPLEAKSS